ncbi:hypothetical protein F5Y15DRAFT_144708 [Xylariaceae sp. FL0016]|nr:hypothetical protein F5Y15DRAFT_144708 [Xylariaceae sp. FL0016]
MLDVWISPIIRKNHLSGVGKPRPQVFAGFHANTFTFVSYEMIAQTSLDLVRYNRRLDSGWACRKRERERKRAREPWEGKRGEASRKRGSTVAGVHTAVSKQTSTSSISCSSALQGCVYVCNLGYRCQAALGPFLHVYSIFFFSCVCFFFSLPALGTHGNC